MGRILAQAAFPRYRGLPEVRREDGPLGEPVACNGEVDVDRARLFEVFAKGFVAYPPLERRLLNAAFVESGGSTNLLPNATGDSLSRAVLQENRGNMPQK